MQKCCSLRGQWISCQCVGGLGTHANQILDYRRREPSIWGQLALRTILGSDINLKLEAKRFLYTIGHPASRLTTFLGAKLTEKTPVIGPYPLFDQPTLIVKPKEVQ